MHLHIVDIKVLEIPELPAVKGNKQGDDFRITKPCGSVSGLYIRPNQKLEGIQIFIPENLAEIINLDKSFYNFIQ